MRAHAFLVAAALVSSGACHIGARAERFRPAQTPLGAAVVINGSVTGELLTVADSGLLVLADRVVMSAPLTRVRTVRIRDVTWDYRVGPDHRLDPRFVARLRLLARYPQGLREDQLAELLRRTGQAAVAPLP